MPTIQNKKSKTEHYVTVEDWQTVFIDKGLDRRYEVIDDGDIQDTVIATPQAFAEPVSFDIGIEGITRNELKIELEKMDVEYNTRASTQKLYQLYLDNQ